ncbi:unnamed protein product [Blepharisma stoltei]|uniref:Uncharacterized protein n=1 Tax=Blepharisma stoltei TaxID=1481888 RepID=A0AAU9JYP0_9CILI|nr:unnamed protein product [Blepharisma stoltei]
MPFIEIPKIFRLDYRIWWIIFFVSQILIFALMLGSIFTTKWVQLDPSIIKGGLLYQKEFVGATVNKYYWDVYDKECEGYHKFSLCKLVKDLGVAGRCFAAFEWIGFFFLLVWIGYFVNFVMKCGNFRCFWPHRPYCEAITVVVCHYLATIVWLANSHAEFKSDCKWDGNKRDIPTICAEDGPNTALFLMIFLPIVVTVFICVFQVAYKDLLAERERIEGQPVQMSGYIPPVQYAPQGYQASQQYPVLQGQR